MSLIKRGPFFIHPLFIFISSLVALGISLYLYISSYLEVNAKLTDFVKKSNIPLVQFQQTETWVMILILSILVSLIIVGFSMVFYYYQKLRQLYRMQQNFINGFTHELKTPVASIAIFIDTLKRHSFEREKQLEYLDIMRHDTERLGDNIEQILQLGRLEEKKVEPDLRQINIRQTIEEFVHRNRHNFSELDISFVHLDNEESIEFDSKLFDILLMNILTNAIRYNSKEVKTMEIIFQKGKRFSELFFVDNGDGVEEKDLKNIFKKFYQVGKSSKGSGVGLYMATQIMKIHGGRISAESEGVDQGMTLKLLFKNRVS
ncbi:HAMP domain-containing sensor histidine kinase [Halobacteriovorax sp. XZX-3]|uniref:sensor histidine kinase n=1 Tax=unclassified Halobacteriovorax TaxID=2639665 RepID=UPI00372178CD